jgi:uncharacterized protein (TIGR01777 family)
VTRRPAQPEDIAWQPERGEIDARAFEAADVVVHLAGENIADGRWTNAKKQRIRDSRVQSTQLLSATLARLSHRPQLLVSASAVGYYGDRGEEVLTEESASGRGFLAEVCRQWEAATQPAVEAGIRTVCLRHGFVLAADGGALRKALLPFTLGLGVQLGSGRQHWSWISLRDWLDIILYCLATETLCGAVNAVAPTPVTNAEFARTLAQVLRQPVLASVPAFAVRLALGEIAEEVVYASAHVVPARLQASGYLFTHTTLATALQDVLRPGKP